MSDDEQRHPDDDHRLANAEPATQPAPAPWADEDDTE